MQNGFIYQRLTERKVSDCPIEKWYDVRPTFLRLIPRGSIIIILGAIFFPALIFTWHLLLCKYYDKWFIPEMWANLGSPSSARYTIEFSCNSLKWCGNTLINLNNVNSVHLCNPEILRTRCLLYKSHFVYAPAFFIIKLFRRNQISQSFLWVDNGDSSAFALINPALVIKDSTPTPILTVENNNKHHLHEQRSLTPWDSRSVAPLPFPFHFVRPLKHLSFLGERADSFVFRMSDYGKLKIRSWK